MELFASHKKFVFKWKREHTVKVDIPTRGYPNQHTDIIFPIRLIDHVMVLNTFKVNIKSRY